MYAPVTPLTRCGVRTLPTVIDAVRQRHEEGVGELDILAEVDLFETIPSEGLAVLAKRASRRTFQTFSRLMYPGEIARSLHVIVKGRVRLERRHPSFRSPVILEELGPGEIVGERGLLDGQCHRDTVTAIDETETLELDRAAVAGVVLLFPETTSALLAAVSVRLHSPAELIRQLAPPDQPGVAGPGRQAL
jgi:CRP-like cAMP-binding protein